MHSVFRIGFVEKIENSDRLWQVNLTLSKSNDPELLILMKSIESDIDGPTGWFQLGNLMMRVAQFDKAEQIYNIVLNQETDEITKGYIYHQRTLQESITYYEKALEIREKTLPASHSELATTYNNLGMLYQRCPWRRCRCRYRCRTATAMTVAGRQRLIFLKICRGAVAAR